MTRKVGITTSPESVVPFGQLPPGGGGTRLHKPYRFVPPQRVGFLQLLGLKTAIDFAYFRLESVRVFEGITGVYKRIYHFISKLLSRERKISKFEMDFKKPFLLLF